MFRASAWQWERYKYKVDLVASYKANSTAPALALPVSELSTVTDSKDDSKALASLLHKKVHLAGTIDYDRQIIVTNRRNAEGPGHVLFAPLLLDGTGRVVWLGRGFIPFADREPQSWRKYDSSAHVELDGVVQETRRQGMIGPSNPEPTAENPVVRTWLFEDVEKMSAMFPDRNFLKNLFVEQLGGPEQGRYPEQAVTIQVPPSTHFGYTIEWALLGTLTLVLSVLLQVFAPGTKQARIPEVAATNGYPKSRSANT